MREPAWVALPHGLMLRMGVISFSGVNLITLLPSKDLNFAEFSIPVLIIWVVA